MAGTRTRSPRDLASIPTDFPHANRLGGSELFRTVLGGIPKSTFARWLSADLLPTPTRVAGLNLWPESSMAQVMRDGTRSPTTPPTTPPDAALA